MDQIARDKEERKQRLEKEKNEAKGIPVQAVAPQPKPVVVSDATQTKLQIRMSMGGQFVQVFESKEPLAAVRCLILSKEQFAGCEPSDVVLMCPMMGRKVFTDEDMTKTLTELGLAPSAVLMAQRK